MPFISRSFHHPYKQSQGQGLSSGSQSSSRQSASTEESNHVANDHTVNSEHHLPFPRATYNMFKTLQSTCFNYSKRLTHIIFIDSELLSSVSLLCEGKWRPLGVVIVSSPLCNSKVTCVHTSLCLPL